MSTATTPTTKATIIGPGDGRLGFLGSIGIRWMIEDEHSYVLQGRMGALLGEEVVEAGAGDLVFKPRNQWHTFWNAGDEPCRVLEIISPAGFERFFEELDALGGALHADPEALAELNTRYRLEMQPESVPVLL